MSLKKLLAGFFFLFVMSIFSAGKVQAACDISRPSCEMSFDQLSQTTTINFNCMEDAPYTLSVLGLNPNYQTIESTFQSADLPNVTNSIAINPIPDTNQTPLLMVTNSQGDQACAFGGPEINYQLERAQASCRWEALPDPTDPGFRFCIDFPAVYNGQGAQAEFYCENSGSVNSCGGLIEQARAYSLRPIIELSTPFATETGTRSCLDLRGYDAEGVMGAGSVQVARSCLQEAAVTVGGFAATAILPGAGITRVIVGIDTIMSVTQQQCVSRAIAAAPHYVGEVKGPDGESLCRSSLQLSFEGGLPTIDDGTDGEPLPPYEYCMQVPPDQRASCQACIEKGGVDENNNPTGTVYTAVGCIGVGGEALAANLIRLLLGIAGGVALLSILAGAFIFSTSQGESNRVKEAKELLTAAITGIFFIIFSVIILDFIGVKILQIPGLG